ncbi:MAG: hypothetical protein QW552_03555 [Ignisphaera sp.]
MPKLDSIITEKYECKSIDGYKDYEEFKEIEIKINKIQDLCHQAMDGDAKMLWCCYLI